MGMSMAHSYDSDREGQGITLLSEKVRSWLLCS
jgi:hypothetical protein